MTTPCRANIYTDSSVIFHGPIMCWGFEDQPPCIFLRECLLDYKETFEKNGRSRKFITMLKRVDKANGRH
jgi:hypothetical protein